METHSLLNPVKISEHLGRDNELVKLITGILHWKYKTEEVYSLARCYILPNKVIVVLSGLAIKGFYPQPLASDYVAAANTFWQAIGENLNVLPEDIIWIEHLGLFSAFDTVWSVDIDEFSRYELSWNGTNFYDIGAEAHHVIDEDKEATILIPLPLIPVEKVLKSLGWKDKYGS